MLPQGPELTPPRSRFFTITGWCCILLGVYVPARVAYDYWTSWDILVLTGALRQYKALRIASCADLTLQGALAIISGWGLYRRRSWAPRLACFTAGMLVVDACCNLLEAWPRIAAMVIQALKAGKTSLEEGMSVGITVSVTRLILWLTALGGLVCERGRCEFPPRRRPFTTSAAWIASGSGAVLSGLMYALMLWLSEPRFR